MSSWTCNQAGMLGKGMVHLFQILELKLLLTVITEAKGSDASQSEVQKVHLKIF